MRGSIRLGKLFGIDIYAHFTFVLLLVFVAVSGMLGGGSFVSSMATVGLILTLFGCVALHELGHALMARQFGIRTRDINLLPIGGVARLERMPEKPIQEILVAIAGPAVNVAIAAALTVWLVFSVGLSATLHLPLLGGAFLVNLLVVNVTLLLFNLLPAFPMDGGRVLRALMAMRMDYATATRKAASVGKVMAVLFGLTAFFTNTPMLFLIAFFVWYGGAQEAAAVAQREAMRRAAREGFPFFEGWNRGPFARPAWQAQSAGGAWNASSTSESRPRMARATVVPPADAQPVSQREETSARWRAEADEGDEADRRRGAR